MHVIYHMYMELTLNFESNNFCLSDIFIYLFRETLTFVSDTRY